jgi:3-isopropylmalate/(R)-2-methylmalate dehydratase small subunit
VKPGDIIVAGKNFGCGSSREQAVIALKRAGIAAIIAPSFARIYFRNAINEGLPTLENSEAPEHINNGDEISIDFEKGKIIAADGKIFNFPPLPPAVSEIVESGGLVPYLKKKLAGV